MTKENENNSEQNAPLFEFLNVEGRPELSIFPSKISFSAQYLEKGEAYSANSVYEPDIDSYKQGEGRRSLKYKSAFGSKDTLVLVEQSGGWQGAKFIGKRHYLMCEARTQERFLQILSREIPKRGEFCAIEKLPEEYIKIFEEREKNKGFIIFFGN